MCRRCGEPDRRGSAADRRARRARLLTRWGDGATCPCVWCGAGLDRRSLEVDRLVQGGPYASWNVVPSCGPCNRARAILHYPEGCDYGTFPRVDMTRAEAVEWLDKRTA